MDRNIKYKQVCRIQLFGDDDVNTTTNSQYIVYPSSLPSVTVNNGGTNYVPAFTQIRIVGGGGSGAVAANPTVSSGVITAITLSNSGIGYSAQPNIIITSGISSVSNLVGGTGYTNATTQITISGGGGSGAVLIPVISGGVITMIPVGTSGAYSTVPTITITSGITGSTNIVGGSGYTNGTYDLIVSGGGGSGCTGTFTITGGALASISITNAGTGYTSAPTFSFANAPFGGTGASATATLGTGASATAVVGTGASASISGIFTNGKRMRFALNNSLNDLKLSQTARCIVESCNIPSITNLAGKYVSVRIATSSQDKTCDTKKFLNGNPILLSMATQSTVNSPNIIYNASEFFYNVNVPYNLFSNGYLDLELECPTATANIDFITNKPLSTFFLNLIIIDEDPQLTKDLTLAPPIDYRNYNVNMPIRPY